MIWTNSPKINVPYYFVKHCFNRNCVNYFQRTIILIIWIISFVYGDVQQQGYDYTPPKVKLCNDGTVRENCDVCPEGTYGTYPNCKKPQCAQGNCTHSFTLYHHMS